MTNSRWRNGPRGAYSPHGRDIAGDIKAAAVFAVGFTVAISLLLYYLRYPPLNHRTWGIIEWPR
jgi:hypothetical protein